MRRHAATRINQDWICDFVPGQADDGGRLKWLPIVDECSRELLSIEVARSITVEDVVRELERLGRERGAPEYPGSDNGPGFVSRAVRDRIAEKVFKTFFLDLEVFVNLPKARIPGEEHRYKYNHQRPHSSLGDRTPAESASRGPSRCGLRLPLRRTARTTHDPDSNRSWFKERGHASLTRLKRGCSQAPVRDFRHTEVAISKKELSIIRNSTSC